MGKIEWHEATENNQGIQTIGMIGVILGSDFKRIIGYNGIMKGDKVLFENNEYTIVMVSRLGHFGLSETGKLPYTKCVLPNEVIKLTTKN
ncbi:hypothetical protein PDK26_23585 [Bacillus cereus]|nr:hypothetical protein [Bacillus cereus]